MKQLLLVLFLVSPFVVNAQNYQLVNSANNRYLSNNQGEVIGIEIDSVDFISGDSIFYFFTSIREADPQALCSHTLDSTSWLGDKAILKPNGDHYCFNARFDTLLFKTQALLNDTWTLLNQNDTLFNVQLVAHDTMTVLGVLDSVKTIEIFEVLDEFSISFGHAMVGTQFQFGKVSGWVKLKPIHGFPNYMEHPSLFAPDYATDDAVEFTLAGKRNPNVGVYQMTFQEVYNFDVGDVFHYEYFNNAGPSSYHLYTVVNKYSSTNLDTVFYDIEDIHEQNWLDWSQNPPLVTNVDTNIITKWFTHLDSLVMPYLPEEGTSNDLSSNTIRRFIIESNSVQFNGRLQNTRDSDILEYNSWFDCLGIGFDPIFEDYNYISGCGDEYTFDYPAEGHYWGHKLIYFSKGNETWGNPHIITGQAEFELEKHIVIFPNPGNGMFKISIGEDIQLTEVEIVDAIGKQILYLQEYITGNYTLNLAHQSAGVYFLKAKTSSGLLHKKLIIQ